MQKDDWVNMSTGEQQEFIKRLKGLIARYDEYDRDSAHWEGFGSNNPNEWVYRVPLSMLP
jgi:serine/threonine-protein kinase PpkA